MRNLKKVLALVLALMMVLSVMVFASAKGLEDYEDAAEVSDEYAEAVDVLTSLGIYEGDEGGFRPQDNITRAEVTALVYRVLTGDVAAENQAHIWAGSATDEFNDLPSTVSWAYGYIGYATHYGYVVGSDVGVFDPNGNITGYQLLAIMLRAVGYDQNGEFEGDAWAANVAQIATERGILDGFDVSLSSELTREEVAYLIFNAIRVAQVTYTPALGYNQYTTTITVPGQNATLNDTLGFREFGLVSVSTRDNSVWGQPGDQWYYDAKYDTTDPSKVTNCRGDELTFIADDPLVTYYTPVTECDVADDLGINVREQFTTYTNGERNSGTDWVTASQTVDVIGAQGRRTEIYENGAAQDVIVYIDTFRAEVKNVIDRTFDVSGHVRTPAQLEVTIYSGIHVDGATGVNFTYVDWDADYDFSRGDVLAVNKLTGGTYLKSDQDHFPILNEDNYPIVDPITKLTPVTVTVDAITTDAASQTTRVVSGNTSYPYNVTFQGTKLTTTAIGSTYRLWLDSRGNILDQEKVDAAVDSGLGVVTGYDVERVDTGKYVIVLDVLQADGTTDQVALNRGGLFYGTLEAAESTANSVFGTKDLLISYEQNATGYYNWTPATDETADNGIVSCGVADTLNTTLVDDDTVFFVADYTYSNGRQEYLFQGYSIYAGFKSIDDLACTTGKIDGVAGVSALDVTVVDTDADDRAEAVLVLNANKQSVPADQPVYQYAYLITDRFVTIGDDYKIYTAIINGVPNQQVRVTTGTGSYNDAETNGTGLYMYGEYITNGWSVVYDPSYDITKNTYSYSAGVLTYDTNEYLTVADDCVVYIINPTTGASVPAALSDLSAAMYGEVCDISYQLDEDGYVNLIYIVENDTSYAPLP